MKRVLSFFAAFMIFASTAVGAYEASDWAAEELSAAESAGVITERLSAADLKKDITREEFAELAVRAYELLSTTKAEAAADNPFSDTENPEVLKAYELGIIKGVSEDGFAPDALLVREEAAVMLARVYQKIMTGDAAKEISHTPESTFADDADISDWAKGAVYFMAEGGIINGVGENKFAPRNTTDEEKASGYANASREQAIILVSRLIASELFSDKMGGDIDPYASAKQDELTKDENAYTVAFIGGSLTEGGHSWISATVDCLQEQMPDKKVQYLNAGKGGTGSPYGAARFMNDVGQYEPDLVFIEFAVNDTNYSEEDSKVYMESMVRMCAKMKSKPAVIFLYAPFPVENTTAQYQNREKNVKWKEQIAKHYGIKSIDIYEYMQSDYENVRAEKGYETFTDYLAPMYSKSGDGYDVHGGYEKYAEAIVKELSADLSGCLTKPSANTSIFCSDNKALVNASYEYMDIDSKRLHYTGEWSTYTADNQFSDTSSGVSINSKHYSYPYFDHGIKQSLNQASGFGFYTKANEICINHISATAGSDATVYIDMVESGTTSCYSSIHGMNYTGGWITLPNDGKQHKVIIIVNEADSSNYVYRFGNVIERFWGK